LNIRSLQNICFARFIVLSKIYEKFYITRKIFVIRKTSHSVSLLVLLNYVCVIKFHSQINSVIGFHIINHIVEKNVISVEIKIYTIAYSRKARDFLFVY